MNQLKSIEISHNMSSGASIMDEKLLKIYEDINAKTKRIVKHLRFASVFVSCHPTALLFALMTYFVYVAICIFCFLFNNS